MAGGAEVLLPYWSYSATKGGFTCAGPLQYITSQWFHRHCKYIFFFLTLPKGIRLPRPSYKCLHLHHCLYELILFSAFSDLDPPRYVPYAERIEYSTSRCLKCYFSAFPLFWGMCGKLRRNLVCSGGLLCTLWKTLPVIDCNLQMWGGGIVTGLLTDLTTVCKHRSTYRANMKIFKS